MMCRTLRRAVSVATALVVTAAALPTAASAQTTFTDFASFLTAVGPYGIDTFDDLDPITSGPADRTAGSYGYQMAAAAAPLNMLFSLEATPGSTDLWLSEETGGTGITFSGFGSAVRGIGGFFFGTDFGGTAVHAPLLLRAEDVQGHVYETILLSAAPSAFFGVVFNHQLATLRLSLSNPDFDFATVNDLVLAEGATSVPEPASVLLLAPGAMLLWRRSRRRNLRAAPHA
jgi:hypothetical protein